MAKREKVLPARKHGDGARDEESLLMRSAESLGRMIGSLQRQLDGATKRLSETADDVMEKIPGIPFVGDHDSRTSGTKKRATPKRTTRAAVARKNTKTRAAATTSAASRKGVKGAQPRKRTASASSKKR